MIPFKLCLTRLQFRAVVELTYIVLLEKLFNKVREDIIDKQTKTTF